MARTFQVEAGSFSRKEPGVDDYVHYKKGDLVAVDDDVDLAAKFKNVFKEVGVLAKPDPKLIEVSLDELKRRAAAADMAVKVAESSAKLKADAEALQAEAARKALDEAKKAKPPAGKTGAKKDAVALAARGVDVTDQFPKAKEMGLVVMQRDAFFHVYQGESTTPLTQGGLATKGDVEKLLLQ